MMLNITNHQANSSQNHNEIPQKHKKNSKDVERRKASHTVCGNGNW